MAGTECLRPAFSPGSSISFSTGTLKLLALDGTSIMAFGAHYIPSSLPTVSICSCRKLTDTNGAFLWASGAPASGKEFIQGATGPSGIQGDEKDGSLPRNAGHVWPGAQLLAICPNEGRQPVLPSSRKKPYSLLLWKLPPGQLVILDKQDGLILKKEGFRCTLLNVGN